MRLFILKIQCYIAFEKLNCSEVPIQKMFCIFFVVVGENELAAMSHFNSFYTVLFPLHFPIYMVKDQNQEHVAISCSKSTWYFCELSTPIMVNL